MRGWLGPGLTETWNTLDLLVEAGVDYVADWVNDDLPYRMNNGLYAIPYSLELNDMPLFNMPSVSTQDFETRIRETFDVLYEEGAAYTSEAVETRSPVRLFRFVDQQEALVFRLRWQGRQDGLQ
jgi:peptidoglycan/xylan/chitin deacetylase (PgdA/CDA1 family)